MNRRQLLAGSLASAVGWQFSRRASSAQDPITAPLRPIDALMTEVVRDHGVVGATLAVAKDGRLVLARGYGLEDRQANRPVRPETLFCIASVTKAITAISALKLVDDGKLDLEARIIELLPDFKPLLGTKIADPRFADITVHHLLYHAGGFPADGEADGATGADDMDDGTSEMAVLIYRSAMGKKLAFAPGSEHRYSNNGFMILRLAIEKASGRPYEVFARESILSPMEIKRMRIEGPQAGPEETQRYGPGGRRLDAWNAVNWLSTPTDMVRFLSVVAGSKGRTFLSPRLTSVMLELPPKPIQPGPRGAHVGLGWDAVRETPQGFRFGKNGGKPGVAAWLEHLPGNVDWAVMFNTGLKGMTPNPMNQLRNRFPPIAEKITEWPAGDLFPTA